MRVGSAPLACTLSSWGERVIPAARCGTLFASDYEIGPYAVSGCARCAARCSSISFDCSAHASSLPVHRHVQGREAKVREEEQQRWLDCAAHGVCSSTLLRLAGGSRVAHVVNIGATMAAHIRSLKREQRETLRHTEGSVIIARATVKNRILCSLRCNTRHAVEASLMRCPLVSTR